MTHSGDADLLFSIVIPSYNYGRYVSRAICSALDQEGDDFEVLVIDDGSTDNTREVVSRFGDRLRYYYQENRGQSASRNRGIDLGRGQFFVFLDADDRLLPGALTHMRRAIQTDPELRMVFGRHVSVTEDGTRTPGRPQPVLKSGLENFRDYLDRKFGIPNGAAAMHRDVFRKHRYPQHIRSGEDLSVFAITLLCFPCKPIDAMLLDVHSHEGRMRHNVDSIRGTAADVIDELFRPDLLPPAAMRYRNTFAARKYLSMSRSFFRAKDYAESQAYFRKAIQMRWTLVFNLTASFRYLKCWLWRSCPCSFHAKKR